MKTKHSLALLCLVSVMNVVVAPKVDIRKELNKFFKNRLHNSNPKTSSNQIAPPRSLARLIVFPKEKSKGIIVNELNLEVLKKQEAIRNRPFKILAHDWGEKRNSESMVELKKAYFSQGATVAVIDWSLTASKPMSVAINLLTQIAKDAQLKIALLIGNDIAHSEKIHLVGYGLGAHVMGHIGKNMKKHIYGITGLDPIKSLIETDDPEQRLDKDDAKFVQVIHTSYANGIGVKRPIGNVDFYINGGAIQDSCGTDLFTCPHKMAYKVYAKAIMEPEKYVGYPCHKFANVLNDTCEKDGELVQMGGVQLKLAKGIYYVDYPIKESSPRLATDEDEYSF